MLPKILESLFAVFPQADRGFILLLDRDTGQLVPRAVHQRRPEDGGRPAVSRHIVNQALSTGRALLSADAGTDARFDPSQSVRSLQICSMMCVPMHDRDGTGLGVIQMETRDRANCFREEDLDVLVCACTQAARAVELAGLYQDRRDLEAATQIQKSFLPRGRPQIPGLTFFDYYASARRVGGDYYDYIPLPTGLLAICIGDVSGKGVPAALLMARLSAAARFSLASEPDPAAALGRLNLTLTETHNDDRFVTFVAALIDPATNELTLLNAGHPPAMRRRGTAVEELGDGHGRLAAGHRGPALRGNDPAAGAGRLHRALYRRRDRGAQSGRRIVRRGAAAGSGTRGAGRRDGAGRGHPRRRPKVRRRQADGR